MSEHNPTHANAGKAGAAHAARKLDCEECEALLVDFLDGTLPPADVENLHAHQKLCPGCGEMFAQAGQGREWLNFLRTEPPVPAVLLSKILAQTSGAESQPSLGAELAPVAAVAIPAAAVVPFWKRNGIALAGRRVVQPRLLMTAAMAFFSITLTLNMAGVRLTTVRLSDLKPGSLSSNLNKQYHMASARVVRYYDNLRFVYELEARVKEMRRDDEQETAAPTEKPDQTPADGNHKSGGKSEGPNNSQPRAMLWGPRVEAAMQEPELRSPAASHQDSSAAGSQSNFEHTDSRAADQAERGIA